LRLHAFFRFKLDDVSPSEFLPVVNFPSGARRDNESGINFYDHGSAVYVDKLNRIYMFGGYTSDETDIEYHDSIWYIDL
jgi:hypothetical protein